MLPTTEIFDVEIVIADVAGAADAVVRRALSGEGGYIVCGNVHLLMTAQRRPEVMAALNDAWSVFADGAPIAWLQRCGHPRAKALRVGGPDLMLGVLDHGLKHGLRHVLFGSTPHVLRSLEANLRLRTTNLNIVDAIAPEIGREASEETFERIAAASPDVLWVALGAPKQELWMRNATRRLRSSLMLGVGAAFDFHAGHKRRAPKWMQRFGLEWIYRLGQEPTRLLRRYVVTNGAFAFYATRFLIRQVLGGAQR